MKSTITDTEKKQIIEALKKAGYNASYTQTNEFNHRLKLLYTCNTDGSVRWVWPRENNHADVLRFYHAKGLRAMVFSIIMQLLFTLRLQNLFCRSFTIYSTKKQTRWGLFTGTIGPNRKMVLWSKEKSKAIFTKIALTENAKLNIANESAALTLANSINHTQIQAPSFKLINDDVLIQEDISTNIRKTNKIQSLPIAALKAWSKPNIRKPLQQAPWWKNIENIMCSDVPLKDQRMAPSIMQKARLLFKQVKSNGSIAMAPQHGDFTPWNVWMKNEGLCIIDWELFENEGPALFDLFHFVYQSNILIGNKGYAAIRKELDALFNTPELKDFIQQYQLDVKQLEQLYLLKNVSSHLMLYSKQEHWHVQVEWLLQTWNEALTFFIEATPPRQALLQDISTMLFNKPYAAMKFTDASFEELSDYSDLDICIAPSHAKELEKVLKRHILVEKLNIKKFSFMHQLSVQLKDHSLIHIDCIFQFKRKSIVFLDSAEVISNAKQNVAGIKLASIEQDFTYTWLFNWLNNGAIPSKYQHFFSNQSSKEQTKLNSYLSKHWHISNFNLLFTEDVQDITKVQQQVLQLPSNKGVKGLFNKLAYVVDTARKFFTHKGFIVTFSGVDGAGKSTVIQNVKTILEKKYRKRVIVLRHRPSLLPILSAWKHGKEAAELKAANTLPRQGNNKNTLSSAMRFAYYYTDYLIGQLYVQLRYVMMGYVVLYDRYYFDFINDSKRSNIHLPKKITSMLYSFLMKPKFNFFLYAKAEEILARKKELDETTINQLTNQYMDLFRQLSTKYKHSAYLPLYNHNLNNTLNTIEHTIQ